ncbi:hypothetical protein ASE01_04295 [Nocardioides sp. Root190]|uniref:hypothetical protein n=1 Tax=Nocardioides sp. Root190 TaxID=1736488 RepID=UPI0006F28D57|nr:hypothetical protein [Nocardioides sp. Root190]KRB78489.1 hypothetical protein ASE01_04295 [Nocardioides sp. Root190]
MKSTLLLAAVLCSTIPLAACANQSRASEADELREHLASLPGVASADLDYTEPVTLDSGKLTLTVALEPEATADDFVTVVEVTYDAFADVHRGEEGDLEITWGDDSAHLRSFEPDADTAAVAAAAEAAVPVLTEAVTRAEINTQDVAAKPHVETRFTVTVAEPGIEGVLAALPDLDRRFGSIEHAGWTVQTAAENSWALNSSDGLPDAAQLDLLAELRQGLPKGAALWLGDDASMSVFLAAGTTPDDASAMVGRHLAILGGAGKAFYDIQQEWDFVGSIINGECYFDSGELGARIEKDHADGCTKVDHDVETS